jgi:hypothetical protein
MTTMSRLSIAGLAGLALLGLAPAGRADIYTWTDENGVTHYSSTRPAGQQANTYAADPAWRPAPRPSAPSARGAPVAAPAESPEAQALRSRVETLEVLLERERSARVDDLREQLDNERDRVRRLEAERAQPPQWSEIGGLWNTPLATPAGVWWNPAPVIVLPPRHHGKSGKPREPRRLGRDPSAPERIPYPSISGPSSNLR